LGLAGPAFGLRHRIDGSRPVRPLLRDTNLAVSVVPPERAGMAVGIFGTMRAAGEAIALAIGLVLFTALLQPQLSSAFAPAILPYAASEVANGNLVRAAAVQSAAGDLADAYAAAFPVLMQLLAAVMLFLAAGAFFGLRRPLPTAKLA
jgi:hypothetical protein